VLVVSRGEGSMMSPIPGACTGRSPALSV
jgi:hypothetical protein